MAPPTMTLATPPRSSHMDLFVGDPVKNREKSEPTEFEALIPKTINMIPIARRAMPIALFIYVFVCGWSQRTALAWLFCKS